MDLDKSMDGLLLLMAVLAVFAYVYYSIGHAAQPKVIEIGDAPSKAFLASQSVGAAGVYFSDGQSNKSCALSPYGDVWHCSSADWNYVGLVGRTMNGVLKKCVWAHPMSNKTLVIDYSSVELGSRMEGFYGMIDGSEEVVDVREVNFSVMVDGEPVFSGASIEPGANDFTIRTAPGARHVTFTVFTEDDSARHFCFDAWVAP
jgi:hypothetical protein